MARFGMAEQTTRPGQRRLTQASQDTYSVVRIGFTSFATASEWADIETNGVTDICAGEDYVVAILANGTLAAYGDGLTDIPQELGVSPEALACGSDFALVLASGTLYGFGSNATGQLNVPEGLERRVISVSAGRTHVLAVAARNGGEVVAWGQDQGGSVEVPDSAKANVLAVAAGPSHSVALKLDGTVVAWGDGHDAIAEYGTLQDIRAVSAGLNFTIAVAANGSIHVVGPRAPLLQAALATLSGSVAQAVAGERRVAVLQDSGRVRMLNEATAIESVTVPAEATSGVLALGVGKFTWFALKPFKGAPAPAPTITPAPPSPPSLAPSELPPPPLTSPPPPQPTPPGSGATTPALEGSASTGSSSSGSGVPVGAIAGAAAGGAAVLIAIAGAVWWRVSRNKRAASALLAAVPPKAATGPGSDGAPRDAMPRSGSGVTDLPEDGTAMVIPMLPHAPSFKSPTASNHNTQSRSQSSQPVSTPPADYIASTSSSNSGPGAGLSAARVQSYLLGNMNIEWRDIQLGALLGEGGIGQVYKGVWMGNKVAVKMLSVDDGAREVLSQEALIMSELRHPCVARVFGLAQGDGDRQALVMHYHRRGTVSKALSTLWFSGLTAVERLKLAQQVVSGMRYLHERQPTPIIHGDLKCSNLLFEDDMQRVVIADFGLATSPLFRTQLNGLTVSISPPEVLADPTQPRTKAADVYAFGIVLLELMTGRQAWRGMRSAEVQAAVAQGLRPSIPSYVSDSVAAVINGCWHQDAQLRPSFAHVAEQLTAAVQEEQGDPGDGLHASVTDSRFR